MTIDVGQRACGSGTLWRKFQMPVTLQGAFRQPDRLKDKAVTKAGCDGIAERLVGDVLLGEFAEPFKPRLDVRLADPVPKRSNQQQCLSRPCQARRSIIATKRPNR